MQNMFASGGNIKMFSVALIKLDLPADKLYVCKHICYDAWQSSRCRNSTTIHVPLIATTSLDSSAYIRLVRFVKKQRGWHYWFAVPCMAGLSLGNRSSQERLQFWSCEQVVSHALSQFWLIQT